MPTHATPPLPLREPESRKIGFVAPILKFPSAKSAKPQTCYVNMVQPIDVIIRKKWNGTNIEQNGTHKIPHLNFRNMVKS